MNFEIVEKKENPLLERTEVSAVVSFNSATPSIQQMREAVVQKLGCNPDLTVIRKVSPGFGEKRVSISVNIYKSPGKMKEVEEAHVLKKNNLLAEGGKEEGAPKEGEPKKEKKGKK
jgi:small subunit ribosomal protein S24e